jgi:hypothetical protein
MIHLKKIKFLAVIITVLLLQACSNDSEKPVITINEPTNGETFDVGDEIHVDFNITDNDELNQFKIDIHGSHDGHTHGKLAEILPAFDTIIIENISGNSINRHIHIDIPNGVWPGPYHVIIYATDKSGNENMEEVDITIRNPIDLLAPSITITAPANGSTLSSSFTVNASITDKLSDGVTDGEIRRIEVKLKKGAQTFDLGDFDESTNFSSAFNPSNGAFARTFNIPSGIGSGAAELEVEAYDSYFNKAHAHIDVTLP